MVTPDGFDDAISVFYISLIFYHIPFYTFLFFLLRILSYCMACYCRLGAKVKLSWKLLSISKPEDGWYMLTYETPEGLFSVLSRSVVMTVPSYVASSLLRALSVCLCCFI